MAAPDPPRPARVALAAAHRDRARCARAAGGWPARGVARGAAPADRVEGRRGPRAQGRGPGRGSRPRDRAARSWRASRSAVRISSPRSTPHSALLRLGSLGAQIAWLPLVSGKIRLARDRARLSEPSARAQRRRQPGAVRARGPRAGARAGSRRRAREASISRSNAFRSTRHRLRSCAFPTTRRSASCASRTSRSPTSRCARACSGSARCRCAAPTSRSSPTGSPRRRRGRRSPPRRPRPPQSRREKSMRNRPLDRRSRSIASRISTSTRGASSGACRTARRSRPSSRYTRGISASVASLSRSRSSSARIRARTSSRASSRWGRCASTASIAGRP